MQQLCGHSYYSALCFYFLLQVELSASQFFNIVAVGGTLRL